MQAVGSRKKVLVADDDEAIQLCMEDIGRQEGWDLLFARDGEECLALLEREKPSLLVLDQRMPKRTGEQVLERLQSLGHELPVIFMSAEKDLQKTERFSCVVRRFTKPFDLEEFVALVNQQLHG